MMRFRRKPKQTPPENRTRTRVVQTAPRAQSTVFSYQAARANSPQQPGDVRKPGAAEPTPKRVTRQHLRRLRTARAGGVMVLCVALLAASLNLNSRPKIVLIGGPGHIFLRPTATYTQAAQQLLASGWTNHNKITVDTSHISLALEKEFPEIDTVSVRLPLLGNQPVVYMQPAIPELVLDTQDGGSFVVDDEGRALLAASAVSNIGQLGLPVVTDQSGLQITPGQVALPTADVSFIAQVAGQLKAEGFQITSLTMPAATSELDVRVKGAGYFIKCNLQGDARAEAGTFIAVEQYLAKQHVAPAQYIDVRVPERAYYK